MHPASADASDEGTRQVVIGVDLGGGSIRAAVIDVSGAIHASVRIATLAAQGVETVLDRVAQAVLDVAAQAGVPQSTLVGLAAPGPLDPYLGVVLTAPNLPGWRNVPVSSAIATRTGHPVVIANDANAAVLGERWFGVGKGYDNLIYIGIGTGLGSGVVANGRLVDGHRGLAVEIGHMSINFNGPPCSCGGRGCLEAYCSNWALERDAQACIAAGNGAAIIAAQADGDRPDAEAITHAAQAGDAAAIEILRQSGIALGAGLANCVNLFSPQRIAIGGGVAAAGDLLLGPALASMRERAMPAILAHCDVVHSGLGDNTGVLGAAGVAMQHLDASIIRP